jgi:flagellar L-ring protein precursor FlgH
VKRGRLTPAGAIAVIAAAWLGAACGPPHVAPFTPRERKYQQGQYAQKQADAKPSDGSLYSEASAQFLEDTRAVRVGDVVVVRIDEQANASGTANTKLNKSTNRDVGVNALLGLMPALKKAHPDIDPEKLIQLAATSDFSGDGQTSRKGQLTGSIAVRVTQQMPNGDLFVEGTKVVMINHEEIHLYISGLVRRADIASDNSVASSRLADAQVEFTGRGDVADQTDRGWLTKILDFINPF